MSSPRLCTAKAFFDCGWSIGWTAIDNLGVDMKSARKFVEDHVLSSVDGKQTVQVHAGPNEGLNHLLRGTPSGPRPSSLRILAAMTLRTSLSPSAALAGAPT